jgi:intracellular sulfur oxidation DsrE/DsrF family protein
LKTAFLAVLFILNLTLIQVNADEVADFLQLDPVPDGIVFEIVEAGEDDLGELLPRVRQIIESIRAEHPDIDFAVVSHGREEFALQTKNQQTYSGIHDNVRSLVADDVPVYVCGTHAGWYGVTAEDFPDYVNVAPTGPGQISLYEELGYYLIVIE